MSRITEGNIFRCNTKSGEFLDSFSASALLMAFIYEILRIMPAVPIGLPRHVQDDDIWIDIEDGNKYKIPKGSVIHCNVIGINYTEKDFHEPEKFDIYRWVKMDQDSHKWVFNKSQNNNDLASFVYGKRDCVGKNLAKKVLQVVMTELIKNYQFRLVIMLILMVLILNLVWI